MKTKFVALSMVLAFAVLLIAGCGNRVSKEVVGIWQIEDIRVSGDTSMFDMQKFMLAIEDQKQLRFELRPDSSISIYTGASEIDGAWYVKRRSKDVYVILEGNNEPTLLGSYQNGKLVNSDTTVMGTIINTIFIKPVVEEKNGESTPGDSVSGDVNQ